MIFLSTATKTCAIIDCIAGNDTHVELNEDDEDDFIAVDCGESADEKNIRADAQDDGTARADGTALALAHDDGSVHAVASAPIITAAPVGTALADVELRADGVVLELKAEWNRIIPTVTVRLLPLNDPNGGKYEVHIRGDHYAGTWLNNCTKLRWSKCWTKSVSDRPEAWATSVQRTNISVSSALRMAFLSFWIPLPDEDQAGTAFADPKVNKDLEEFMCSSRVQGLRIPEIARAVHGAHHQFWPPWSRYVFTPLDLVRSMRDEDLEILFDHGEAILVGVCFQALKRSYDPNVVKSTLDQCMKVEVSDKKTTTYVSQWQRRPAWASRWRSRTTSSWAVGGSFSFSAPVRPSSCTHTGSQQKLQVTVVSDETCTELTAGENPKASAPVNV